MLSLFIFKKYKTLNSNIKHIWDWTVVLTKPFSEYSTLKQSADLSKPPEWSLLHNTMYSYKKTFSVLYFTFLQWWRWTPTPAWILVSQSMARGRTQTCPLGPRCYSSVTLDTDWATRSHWFVRKITSGAIRCLLVTVCMTNVSGCFCTDIMVLLCSKWIY